MGTIKSRTIEERLARPSTAWYSRNVQIAHSTMGQAAGILFPLPQILATVVYYSLGLFPLNVFYMF